MYKNFLEKSTKIQTMNKNILFLLILAITLFTFDCQKVQNAPQSLKPEEIKAKFEYKAQKSSPETIKTNNIPATAKNADLNIKPEKKQNAKEELSTENQCDIVKIYSIPLPYTLLDSQILGAPDFEQLFPISYSDQFIKITQKSFFFGVYTADLIYTLIYNDRTKFLDYYEIVLKLASDLSIKRNFTKAYLTRFKQNFQSDSAKIIIQNAITKTCQQLSETNQISILPFALAGSWSETLYLITGNAIKNQDVSMQVYKIISQQATTIDKFKQYINNTLLDVESIDLSLELQSLSSQLDSIKAIYDQIYVSDNIAIDQNSMQTLHQAFGQFKKHFAQNQ